MIKRCMIAALALLGTFAVTAAERIVNLDVRKGEWISDAIVNDDQSATLFIASNSPRRTRLVQIDPRGGQSAFTLDGMSINHVQALRGSTQAGLYFVGAAAGKMTDDDYRFLLVRLEPNKLVTLWDSSQLPETVRNAQPWMTASDDGKMWSGIAETSKPEGFALSWGSFGDPKAFQRVSMSSIQVPPVHPGFTFDSPSAAVFRRAGKAFGAAVWRGRVFVFDLDPRADNHSSRLVRVLAPPYGGSSASYQAATDELWVFGGTEYAAFDLSRSSANAGRRVSMKNANAHATEAFPLRNGGVVVRAASPTGSFLQTINPGSQAATATNVAAGVTSTYKVSPNGSVVLVEPNGPRSSAVRIVQP